MPHLFASHSIRINTDVVSTDEEPSIHKARHLAPTLTIMKPGSQRQSTKLSKHSETAACLWYFPQFLSSSTTQPLDSSGRAALIAGCMTIACAVLA